MSFLYDITGRSDFINVNSKEIRIDQGRSYDFPLHPANGNIYTTEMIIDPVYHQYAGDYKCQISIPSDPDTHLSYSFKINTSKFIIILYAFFLLIVVFFFGYKRTK